MRKMLQGWPVLALYMLAASCTSKKGTITVEGTVINTPGSTLYLLYAPMDGEPKVKDSVRLPASGAFKLKAENKEESILLLSTSLQNSPLAVLVSDAAKIKVDIDMNDKANPVKVTGSPATSQTLAYNKGLSEQLDQLRNWDLKTDSIFKDQKVSDSVKQGLLKERQGITEGIKKFTTEFINTSKSPMVKIYSISTYQNFALSPQMAGFVLQPLTTGEISGFLEPAVKANPSNTSLLAYKKRVDDDKNKNQQGAADSPRPGALIGKKAPDFTLPDVNDKPVSLSSFRGKYVLVDFWASWCGPCREENPNVVKAWQQFKNKNFAILGVSLDRPGQKDKWLEAIKKDNLTWTHVSDLKFWETAVRPLYGFEGIPYNVLVDPEGTIIADNLRGQDLGIKLAEVLK